MPLKAQGLVPALSLNFLCYFFFLFFFSCFSRCQSCRDVPAKGRFLPQVWDDEDCGDGGSRRSGRTSFWCRRNNAPTRESFVPSWAAHMMPIPQHTSVAEMGCGWDEQREVTQCCALNAHSGTMPGCWCLLTLAAVCSNLGT